MKKITKTGHKFIVFEVLISLVLLFVTCENKGEETPSNNYTVIYNKNADDATGTMENSTFTVGIPGTLRINNFVRNNFIFVGWAKTASSTMPEYTDGQSIQFISAERTITLYAVWQSHFVEGSTLESKFTRLMSIAQSNTTYIIEINSDDILSPKTLSYGAKKDVTIHLKGTGSINKNNGITYSSPLFTIKSDVTLILDGNITILGRVSVDGGTFTMNGGKIYGNTSGYGYLGGNGGVSVSSSGTFTMNGGEISNNTATGTSTGGGGVFVSSGTFTMNDGEISNNTAIGNGGTYTGSGGGVFVSSGTFTMNDGEISGNTTTGSGGGVSVSGGTFTMNDGEISGNTAKSRGGGVYFLGSKFYKTGGTITGSNSTNGNVVKDSVIINNSGHAVYANNINMMSGSNTTKRKETTAGPGDDLSFVYPSTFSGAWDY